MFTVKSERFSEALRAAVERHAASPRVEARLRVGPEAAFWFYQEFGTATFNPDSPNSAGYMIPPGDKGYLTWPDSTSAGAKDGWFFTHGAVLHYGVPPKRIVSGLLDDIGAHTLEVLALDICNLNLDAPSTQDVRTKLINEVMPRVLDMIVERMDAVLRPSREPGGKLGGGVTPGEVFRRSASISIVSEG